MSKKQIASITQEGMRYLDEDKQQKFISFAECYQNYLEKKLEPIYLEEMRKVNNLQEKDIPQLIERIRSWKEVGKRGGRFIEFHTDPPVRFTFENVDEYRDVQAAIIEAGWRTFDGT